MPDMATPTTDLLDVRLQLAHDGETVVGSVAAPPGPAVGFEGYVELIAALERLLGHHERPA
jgi:hypothetical protein